MNSFQADKTQYHFKKSYLNHFPEPKGRIGEILSRYLKLGRTG